MNLRERLPSIAEGFCLALFFTAFVAIVVIIGGTRMAFSLPCYILLAAAGSLTILRLRAPKPRPCSVCLAITTLVFAYLIGRGVLSPAPYIARSDLYSALAAVVVYFGFALIFTGGTARMVFLLGLLLLGLVQVFIGAIQFRDGNNFMPIPWLQRYDYGNRASGFYGCPNHLAGMLEIVGIIGLSIACWSRWPVWSKLLLGYVVACCYVGVIITGSRGAYLSTIASLAVFGLLSALVLRRSTPRLFWTISGLGVLAAVVLAGVIAFSFARSHFLTSRAQAIFETKDIRLPLWQAALPQWQLSPLVGTGSATYLYYGRYFRRPDMQRDPVYVHNDYLQLLAEYGAIGAVGMALVILAHLRNGARNFARLGPKRVAVSQRLFSNGLALNIGALGAVAAYGVHEALDFNLHIPANVLLMAFVFGILANDGVTRDRVVPPVSWSGTLWRLGFVAASLLLLVQSARLFPGEYYAELARAAVRDERSYVAILNATRGLRFDPENPDLYLHLGNARLQLGENSPHPAAAASFYGDAIAAFEKARAIAPQDSIYALQLAIALDTAQRFEEAEWLFHEAMKLDPKAESLRRYYASHLDRWKASAAPSAES